MLTTSLRVLKITAYRLQSASRVIKAVRYTPVTSALCSIEIESQDARGASICVCFQALARATPAHENFESNESAWRLRRSTKHLLGKGGLKRDG
jgi:hypothetical protein